MRPAYKGILGLDKQIAQPDFTPSPTRKPPRFLVGPFLFPLADAPPPPPSAPSPNAGTRFAPRPQSGAWMQNGTRQPPSGFSRALSPRGLSGGHQPPCCQLPYSHVPALLFAPSIPRTRPHQVLVPRLASLGEMELR